MKTNIILLSIGDRSRLWLSCLDTLVLLLPKISILSVPEEVYSRNTPCALNLIIIPSGTNSPPTEVSNLMITTCFWNDFNHINSKSKIGKPNILTFWSNNAKYINILEQ